MTAATSSPSGGGTAASAVPATGAMFGALTALLSWWGSGPAPSASPNLASPHK
jgi:hypothetical protein